MLIISAAWVAGLDFGLSGDPSLWDFAFGGKLQLLVARPQVCGYFYTARGSFYTVRTPQALNKVTGATKTSRSWLLQHDFELPTVWRQQAKEFLLVLLCFSTMYVGIVFKCTSVYVLGVLLGAHVFEGLALNFLCQLTFSWRTEKDTCH